MKHQDYILFDQYILGELSSEEIKEFDNRLKTDGAFETSFNTYKELSSYLENTFENEVETNAFKNNLKSISESHFNKTEAVTQTKKKGTIFKLGQLAIAASVAIFMGIFAYNQFSSPTYDDFNSHDTMSMEVRGDNVEKMIKATKTFNSGDYSEASIHLNELLSVIPDNIELQLYNAITNIELDDFTEADEVLSKLSKGASAFKHRAIWYLALSKLKQKVDDEEIVALLKQIPEGADDYKQAKKLLNKLD